MNQLRWSRALSLFSIAPLFSLFIPMLIDRLLGNLNDAESAARHAGKAIDWIDIEWHEASQRAIRKQAPDGQTIRLLLPLGVTLQGGEILDEGPDRVLAVRIVMTEVIVIRATDPVTIGQVALEIGNLHAPAQVCGEELWVLPDGPVEAVLHQANTPYERAPRPFAPKPCMGMPIVRVSASIKTRPTDAG